MSFASKQITIEFKKFTIEYLLSDDNLKMNVYLDFITLLDNYINTYLQIDTLLKDKKLALPVTQMISSAVKYIKHVKESKDIDFEKIRCKLALSVFNGFTEIDLNEPRISRFFVKFFKIDPIA